MAANDTAALVVALSAQLTKFEKDMQGAVAIADRRTKEIETRFAQTNKVINDQLSTLSNAATSHIGFLGNLLRSLGPVGVAAAVGIGTLVGGLYALANATDEFATKAKRLKEGAETAGLTITQFKALGSIGARVGLDFDETAAFFTKFIANLEQLRSGSGPLFDALLKIDTGLLRQLSTTKDSAEAIDLLVKAFARLEDQTKRLDLARAAGGRGGLGGTRILDVLAQQGSVSGAVAKTQGIDEEQIKRAAQLKTEIEEINRRTANIWGSMFSDEILQKEKESAEIWERIAKAVKAVTEFNPFAGLNRFLADRFIGTDADLPPNLRPPTPVGASFNERFGAIGGNAPLPRSRPSDAGSPSAELAILQRQIALLGEGVTQGEQWKQKRLEIAAAAEKGGLADGVADRALSAFKVTMIAAAVATRERLGVATEEQIVQARLAQLSQDRAKFGLSENEVQKATVVILREAKQAADALAVRQAYLPGLKQLELDARNLRKGLDDVLVSGLTSVTDNLADMATGAKTAAQAVKDMTNSILRDIARLVIRQTITGPIAGIIGEVFGTGGIGTGGGIGKLASGTDFWRGGAAWVGEQGPELLNLPRGSQVIPASAVGRASNGGGLMLNVINNGPPLQQESQRQVSDREFEITVRGIVNDQIASPETNGLFRQKFGLEPSVIQRG